MWLFFVLIFIFISFAQINAISINEPFTCKKELSHLPSS